MRTTILFLAALISVTSGCALTGPTYVKIQNIPTSKAVLYVYRPDIFQNKGIVPGVKIDRQEYAAIPAGGYMPFLLDEGQHEIELVLSDRYTYLPSLKLDVAKNNEYFVRVETAFDMGGLMFLPKSFSFSYKRSFRPLLVDQTTGGIEIVNNKLVDPLAGERFTKSIFIED